MMSNKNNIDYSFEGMEYLSDEEINFVKKAREIEDKARMIKNDPIRMNAKIKESMKNAYVLTNNLIKQELNIIDDIYQKRLNDLVKAKENEKKTLLNAIKENEDYLEKYSAYIDSKIVCVHEFNCWSYPDIRCFNGINERGIHCIRCGLKFTHNTPEARTYFNFVNNNNFTHIARFAHLRTIG